MAQRRRIRSTYLAVVEPDSPRAFRVRFPDFEGVRARARKLDDVSARAAAALRSRVGELLDADAGVPPPSPLEAVQDDPDNIHGFLLKVEVEVPATGSGT